MYPPCVLIFVSQRRGSPQQIVLILCSTPPHSSSLRPTPAKVDFFVTLG